MPAMDPWENYSQQATPTTAQDPWEAYAGQTTEQPGLLSRVSSALQVPGNAMRAGIGALEKGGGFSGAYNAAAEQFGDSPPPAPSGSDIGISVPNNWFTRNLEGGLLKMAHIPVSPDALPPDKAANLIQENATDPLMYAAEGPGLVAKALKRNIVIKPILDSLAESKASLNPATHAEAIGHIDQLVSDIKGPNWGGKVSKDRLAEISDILQNHSVEMPTQESQDAANRAAVIADKLFRERTNGFASRMFEGAKSKVANILPEDIKYAKTIKNITPKEVAAGIGAIAGRQAGNDVAPNSGIAPWVGGFLGAIGGAGTLGLLQKASDLIKNPDVVQAITGESKLGLIGNRLQNQGLLSR